MDIPMLPTDNLYKFLAIGGIALFAISAFYPPTLTLPLRSQIAQITTEQEELKAQSAYLQEDIEQLKAKKKSTAEDLAILVAKARELELQAIKITGKIEQVKVLKRQADRIGNLAIAGGAIGGLMAFQGFIWWYRRVQKHLDSQLSKS